MVGLLWVARFLGISGWNAGDDASLSILAFFVVVLIGALVGFYLGGRDKRSSSQHDEDGDR